MRVGILTDNLSPEEGGGFTFEREIYRSIIEASGDTSHSFTIFTGIASARPRDNIQLVKRSTKGRLISQGYLRTIGLAGYSRYWDTSYWEKKLYDTIFEENKVDIMWCLNPFVTFTEVPFFATVWDLEHRVQPYFPEVSAKGEWDRRESFYRKILPRAAGIFTGTETCKKDIEYFYRVPFERIHVIPFPTPRFASENTDVDKTGILDKYQLDKNYIFYPAQFWPHKNHVTILKAIRWLRDEYNSIFSVVFVGSDKGNKNHVQEQIEVMRLESQARLLGFVSTEDLVALYRNAFALVFPTYFGPDNLPPLEAFGLGCPVIASEIAGAREQLGNAAKLVDPKDYRQFALAVKELRDNPSMRAELIERGKTRAASWIGSDYVKKVFSILDAFEIIRTSWK